MSTYSVDFDLAKAVNVFIPSILKGATASAMDLAGLIQEKHRSSPRSGRTYNRGHKASAAGEAPAPDTGRLLGAIFATEAERVTNLHIRSSVVVNTEYAMKLEQPTEKANARPFILVTAVENWNTRTLPIFAAIARQS